MLAGLGARRGALQDARLWPRRRGEHLNGPERNINKRTPAGARARARARLGCAGARAARFKGAARAPPPARPSPFVPAQHLAPETCRSGGGGGRVLPGASPSIRLRLPRGLTRGRCLLRQVRDARLQVCLLLEGGRGAVGKRRGGGRLAEDGAPDRDNQLPFFLHSYFPRRRQ